MNELGNRYALAALKDKRATIASEIVQLERQIRHRKEMLIHVDASLLILDPDADPDAIPLKKIGHIKLFRQGELGRMITDALRGFDKPVNTSEVVTAILAQGGHGEAARQAVGRRVRGNLTYLERTGRVIRAGCGASVLWSLADR